MTRHPDWPQRLAAYLQAARPLPFAWVANDCCTFAAGAVLTMTGTDPMAPHRHKYKTQRGAARVLAQAGGLLAWVVQALGEPLLTCAMAQRGDVVLYAMAAPHGPHALGICVGTHIAAPGPGGMVLLPMGAAAAAWRV
jgi:hypothetical protein